MGEKEREKIIFLQQALPLGKKNLVSQLCLFVLPHLRKLQQFRDDLERTRHVPHGERALGRVTDGSRKEILGRELQLDARKLGRLFRADQGDG